MEQSNVHVTVAVKIGNARQVPSCWKGGQQCGANDNVIVQKDYCSLPSGALENHEIGIVVAIKICCRYQLPAGGQSGSGSSSNECRSRQIPDSGLKCVWREERVIWMGVNIEVR